MIGLLMAWAVVGTEGIPIPYSPRMDDGITVVLLCCFFLSAYVLSRSRKFLLQLVKDFLLHRERTSIFATSSTNREDTYRCKSPIEVPAAHGVPVPAVYH